MFSWLGWVAKDAEYFGSPNAVSSVPMFDRAAILLLEQNDNWKDVFAVYDASNCSITVYTFQITWSMAMIFVYTQDGGFGPSFSYAWALFGTTFGVPSCQAQPHRNPRRDLNV